jgi:proline racemase
MIDLRRARDWQPPPDWIRITTVDAHTEGEPLRVILAGYPELPGSTILARRAGAREQYDYLRTALMWEPRGHADMYGCLIVPPERADSDFGVLFLHNEGYSTMCGHGIIAVTTVLYELGAIDAATNTVRIDAPAGQITARPHIEDGRVHSVSFLNVPSYAAGLDCEVEVPGLGTIRYDLGFGGAYYAYVDVAQVGLSITPADYRPA